MRFIAAACFVVCSCSAEQREPEVIVERRDAVIRTNGPSPGARYGQSLASCASSLLVGAPGAMVVFSNGAELMLPMNPGLGDAVDCAGGFVAVTAPGAGLVFTTSGNIDASSLGGQAWSLGVGLQVALPQVAVGAPRDGCLADAGCAGAVLVWSMGTTPQQLALCGATPEWRSEPMSRWGGSRAW